MFLSQILLVSLTIIGNYIEGSERGTQFLYLYKILRQYKKGFIQFACFIDDFWTMYTRDGINFFTYLRHLKTGTFCVAAALLWQEHFSLIFASHGSICPPPSQYN